MGYQFDKLKQAVMEMVEPARYRDVLHGGCQSGAVGQLISYYQTVAFHDKHEEAIWNMIYEQMNDSGETQNIVEFIASWNGSKDVGSMDQFKNLLSWYATEEIVRQLSDELEDNDIDAQDEEATKAFYAAQSEE